jgi:hypothetical protein
LRVSNSFLLPRFSIPSPFFAFRSTEMSSQNTGNRELAFCDPNKKIGRSLAGMTDFH